MKKLNGICRLRITYRSLEATGKLQDFDFFILSDSTNLIPGLRKRLPGLRYVKRSELLIEFFTGTEELISSIKWQYC